MANVSPACSRSQDSGSNTIELLSVKSGDQRQYRKQQNQTQILQVLLSWSTGTEEAYYYRQGRCTTAKKTHSDTGSQLFISELQIQRQLFESLLFHTHKSCWPGRVTCGTCPIGDETQFQSYMKLRRQWVEWQNRYDDIIVLHVLLYCCIVSWQMRLTAQCAPKNISAPSDLDYKSRQELTQMWVSMNYMAPYFQEEIGSRWSQTWLASWF